MAYYLVFARPRATLVNDLEAQLAKHAFLGLQPFGRALTASLRDARRLPDGTAVWEEEDYCRPPLAQERAAVLDHYFEDLSLERVPRGQGWQRIGNLPPLFPALGSAGP